MKQLSCILVTSKENAKTEKDFYQNTLKIANKFIFVDNLEQARMMVLGQRGFLPIDAIGKLPEAMAGIKRLPLYQKDKRMQRNYFACWQKDKTNYYIEEFARIIKKLLNDE